MVSIITPSYNSEKYITMTIESVLKQTYTNWEMIIIDDCSTDNSLNIIQQYENEDTRIKVIKNKYNLGAAESRNKAINIANGEYIAFLDSDDIWFPDKLKKQIEFMQSKNVLMSYSAYNTMDENGVILGRYSVKKKIRYKDMLKTSIIGTLTTIYNVKVLGKYYFMDIGHEDYVLKLQILKNIPYAEGIDVPLASYRIRQEGLSSNKFKVVKWQWHIYRKVEKLSLLQSIYYFIHYAYHGIIKYR